jgi:tartrate dehydratase beta subunit/fumarate hydratase class I family protein
VACQPYISAVTSGITFSGPPSVLDSFFQKQGFEQNQMPLPVHGPYHAPHLHSNIDLEKILHLKDSAFSRILSNVKPRFPVISCTSGTWFSTDLDCKALLLSVVREILTESLQFQKILHGCVVKAQSFRGTKCFVIPFGPTTSARSLADMLKAQTSLDIAVNRSSSKDRVVNSEVLRGKPKLAIVGMAGRFPDAASHEKLWELLEKGLDVHREVPKDRFDLSTHVDASGKARNTSHTPFGCWIENPGLFDPRFFNMSPREAFQTDPMQRMALTTAYEALEMSGYVPNRTRSTKLDRIGTFYGQTSDDWREINAAQDVDTCKLFLVSYNSTPTSFPS